MDLSNWRLPADLHKIVVSFFNQGYSRVMPCVQNEALDSSRMLIPTTVRSQPTQTTPTTDIHPTPTWTRQAICVAVIMTITIVSVLSKTTSYWDSPDVCETPVTPPRRRPQILKRTSLRGTRTFDANPVVTTGSVISTPSWTSELLRPTSKFLGRAFIHSPYIILSSMGQCLRTLGSTTFAISSCFHTMRGFLYRFLWSIRETLCVVLLTIWRHTRTLCVTSTLLASATVQFLFDIWDFPSGFHVAQAAPPFPMETHKKPERPSTACRPSSATSMWVPIEFMSGARTKINPNNLVLLETFAQGSFGRVSRAAEMSSGRSLAIKRVSKGLLGERGERLLLDEIEAHYRLAHDSRFPSLLGCFLDQCDYILVMPLFPRGNLSGLIKNSKGCFDRHLAKFYCAELLLAIRALHKSRIIHGDLKPENILIGEGRHLIVSDFGLSQVFKQGKYHEDGYPLWKKAEKRGKDNLPLLWPTGNPHTSCKAVGTAVYAAPEVFLGQPYSYGVDYWSMGVIYHEMITGHLPFDVNWKRGSPELIYPLIVSLTQHPCQAQALDILSLRFLERVLSPIPENRPSVLEMKRDHLWYDLNWREIRTQKAEVPEYFSETTTCSISLSG